MCTLILAWRVFDGTPVAAAANRDEATGRPSRPPGVLDDDPTVVAPLDEEAGGTWIGYNDRGLFVGVTNRRTDREARSASEGGSGDRPRLTGERSRGLLVRDALARENADDAVAYVESQLAERDYAGFNLAVADADRAVLLEWDGVLRSTALGPGVHVVVNEGYDGEAPKSSRVRDAVRPDSDETTVEAWFDRAKGVLADHDLGACVHGEEFGTRSSSLVALDESGAGRYWFADGRPCETDYEAVDVGRESSGRDVGDAADGQI